MRPVHKAWETRGRSHLFVIADYRIGFEIASGAPAHCQLRVYIEYSFSVTTIGRILGPLLAHVFARCCVKRMVDDAEAQFLPSARLPLGGEFAGPELLRLIWVCK